MQDATSNTTKSSPSTAASRSNVTSTATSTTHNSHKRPLSPASNRNGRSSPPPPSLPTHSSLRSSSSSAKLVPDFYQWPVFFAIMPPVLSLYYGGNIEEWSEGFMLLVMAFYLYGLIKLPWELYVVARRANCVAINRVALAHSQVHASSTAAQAERLRSASSAKLQFLQWFYFILVFASPLGGALFIRYLRPHLHLYKHLIDQFPMALYVLTAYIRPLIHLSRSLKQHASTLYDEISYPDTDVDRLKKQIQDLEHQVEDLKQLCLAMRDEAETRVQSVVENRFDVQIKDLNKDLRKSVRKERKILGASMEKVREIEIRLQDQEAALTSLLSAAATTSTTTVHHHHHRNILLVPAYWLLDTVPSMSFSNIAWMPFKAAARLTSWWIPNSVKRMLPPAPSLSSPLSKSAPETTLSPQAFPLPAPIPNSDSPRLLNPKTSQYNKSILSGSLLDRGSGGHGSTTPTPVSSSLVHRQRISTPL